MTDIKEKYSSFYKNRNSLHVYPVELVVRTLLGTYPNKRLDKTKYEGSKILDLGFGDGRNLPLLFNSGFNVHGVEITEEILDFTKERMKTLGVEVELKKGSNAFIPYPDGYFDYLLSSFACYYIDTGTNFSTNLDEIARVIAKDGYLLCSVGKIDNRNYLLKEVEELEDGHFLIKTDLYNGVRNGYTLKFFKDQNDIISTFGKYFTDFEFASFDDEYYGLNIIGWFFVCKRK